MARRDDRSLESKRLPTAALRMIKTPTSLQTMQRQSCIPSSFAPPAVLGGERSPMASATIQQTNDDDLKQQRLSISELGKLKRSTSKEVTQILGRAAVASAATTLIGGGTLLTAMKTRKATKPARYKKLQVLKSEYQTII